ncbi:hypothetical protein WJX77_009735 [Trebouxia sp. C0004]
MAVPNCAKAALRVFVRMQTLPFHINTKWYKSMLLQGLARAAPGAVACRRHLLRGGAFTSATLKGFQHQCLSATPFLEACYVLLEASQLASCRSIQDLHQYQRRKGTLTPRNTPYFRQNGASCSRARSAVDPGGSAQLQEHQDENIQQPSDPTQQTWYQDPELPERKKMKLQQGQCLIRLLDKQSSLLQQLIATTTSRTSSPAHVDRLQHDNCAIGECY